jgi:hypothetical protein
MRLPTTSSVQSVFAGGLLAIGLGLADNTMAALLGRLEATPGSGDYQAYYDDELNITWLADANFARTTGYSDEYSADGSMPWSVANAWAASLNIQGISGWRLPEAGAINGFALTYSYAVDGTTDSGFNISAWRSRYAGSTANEMAHLFFNTLGNTGFRNLRGAVVPGWEVPAIAPFTNVDADYYWTGTESGVDPGSAAAFSFHGEQSWGNKDFYFRAWPVYAGDVALGPDTDGDGILDAQDNCPNAPNGPLISDTEGGADQQDDDGDGIGNACDLLIPPQLLPAGYVGNAYNHALTILRGQPPYTCTLDSGSLPANLTLGSDCVISGDVVAGGVTATFTARVLDDTGDSATRVLTLRSKIPNCMTCHTASNE